MYGLSIEIALCCLLFIQLCLLGMGDRGFWNKLFVPATYIGYAAALILGVIFWHTETNTLFYASLRNEQLFQPIRLLFVLVGLVIIRMLLVSREIGEQRKKEIVILFGANTLMGCALILSQSLLLSFMLLGAIGLISCLLVGVSFFSHVEFEGATKNWNFTIAAICFGFGSLGVLAIVSGGLSYLDLRLLFAKNLEVYNFILLSLCLLPFFWVGGVFPFHFFTIDRDHAARWPIQAHLGVQVVGSVVLALMGALVTIFQGAQSLSVSSCLIFVSHLGLAGAVWGALAAFSQKDAKRQWAYFSLALWSLVLVSVGTPSPLGLASGIFWASTVILAQALFVSTMGRLSERSGSSNLVDIAKHKHPGVEIGFLLFALTCLQPLPPLPGFVSLINLLSAGSERNSLVFILLIGLVFLLFAMCALRVYVDFTRQFMRDDVATVTEDQSRMRIIDHSLAVTMVCLLFYLGGAWDLFFTMLMQHAKNFIIS